MSTLFPGLWDESKKSWRNSADQPSLWDAYQLFSNDVLVVTENVQQGTILVQTTWTDPAVAARWANLILKMANDRARARAIAEARKNVKFLRDALNETSLQEVRESINSVIAAQIQKEMIANTRPDFAFEVIDPAKTKDLDAFDYPKLTILAPAGAVAGAGIYLFALLVGVLFASAPKPR